MHLENSCFYRAKTETSTARAPYKNLCWIGLCSMVCFCIFTRLKNQLFIKMRCLFFRYTHSKNTDENKYVEKVGYQLSTSCSVEIFY